MMGRGRGQPAAGEGIYIIETSTCDGEGQGTASCREGDQHMCVMEGGTPRHIPYSRDYKYPSIIRTPQIQVPI